MKAISPNFIVRVPKDEQSKRREMDNGLYLHPNFVWMTRNMQCGEIVDISDEAKKEMPEAEKGDLLLLHHFVERSYSTKGDNKKFLIHEDDEYNYYNVCSKEWNGNNNQCYGVSKNGSIVPHQQYIFLEPEIEDKEGWHQSKDEVYAKLETIKQNILNLAKNGMTDEKAREITKLEKQQLELNLSLQKKEYLPYKVATSNEVVWVLNIAAQTKISFLDKEYIVAERKYVGAN